MPDGPHKPPVGDRYSGEPHVFVSADTRQKASFVNIENPAFLGRNHLTKLTILTKLTNEPSQPSRINVFEPLYFGNLYLFRISIFGFRISPVLAPLHLSRTLYKSPIFMQNKPNFQKSQMNVNPYNTMDYENIANWTLGQNKPNSNPIKPNFRKAQMNINSLITKDYRKKDDFDVRINKPNFVKGPK